MNLRELREKHMVDLKIVAKHLGVTPGTVSRWEGGTRSPSFENIIKIADALTKNSAINIEVTPQEVNEAAKETRPNRPRRTGGRPRKKKGTEGAG